MIMQREEVLAEDKWQVESLYPSFSAWEEEFKQFSPLKGNPLFKELFSHKGQLGNDSKTLLNTLNHYFNLDRQISKLYTYAHLRHDEDIAHSTHKAAFDRSIALYFEFGQACSWIEPEILSLNQQTLDNYLSDSILSEYHFYLEKLIRLKPHTLSSKEEELLAMAARTLITPHRAFSALNDADFKFGKVANAQGELKDLTHASYGLYMRDKDRTLRQNAFTAMHKKYVEFENSLTELMNGQVQAHVFEARSRHYSTCLEASLFPKNIDTEVYHSLIKAVHQNIDALHSYVALRKKLLNLDEHHLWDMYVPLTPNVNITMSYQEAEDAVIESVAPLGEHYQQLLKNGLKKDRWVDRYENTNKRSGAYSSGCYDSKPFILMNYKGQIRDVFTLAHEAGHSMHSLLSHTQPYHYSQYPIFVAEVASTFNEQLLFEYLFQRTTSDEEKIFLINQKIEEIRTTLFRQTMFSEFELFIHQQIENNAPLTTDVLKQEFYRLNQFYFGPSAVIDREISIEWARIPHFYYNFYVYQYATGLSAAIALSKKVLQGDEEDQKDYIQFLKGGCSKYPIDLLQTAGVNMRRRDAVNAAINTFRKLIKELEKLCEKQGLLLANSQ